MTQEKFESPLPKRLKQGRRMRGLSQKQLMIEAGIPEANASSRGNHYELGRHVPDYDLVRRVAKVLELPVEWFYTADDERAEIILSLANADRFIIDTVKGLLESTDSSNVSSA